MRKEQPDGRVKAVAVYPSCGSASLKSPAGKFLGTICSLVVARCSLLLALLLTGVLDVQAQVVTGDILGTVTDTTGAVVTNSRVTITSAETGLVRSTQTSGSGDYVFNLVPPGTYSVAVEAQ